MLEKYALKFETDLRVVTFDKLMQLDSQTVSEYNTGELLTTLHTDTIMMKDLFGRIIPGMFDSMFVLGACTMLLTSINVTLLIIPVLLAPFFVVALLKFRKKPTQNTRQKKKPRRIIRNSTEIYQKKDFKYRRIMLQ